MVRDPAVHAAVCERVRAWWAALPGWRVLGHHRKPDHRPGRQPRIPDRRREGLTSGLVRGSAARRRCHAARSRPGETTPSPVPSERPDRSAGGRVGRVCGRTHRPSFLSLQCCGSAQGRRNVAALGQNYEIGILTPWLKVRRDQTDDSTAGARAAAPAAGCAGLRNRSSPSSAAKARTRRTTRTAMCTSPR